MHMKLLAELGSVEDENAVIPEEDIRTAMRKVMALASLDCMRGNEVWQVMKDWELEVIQKKQGYVNLTLCNHS